MHWSRRVSGKNSLIYTPGISFNSFERVIEFLDGLPSSPLAYKSFNEMSSFSMTLFIDDG